MKRNILFVTIILSLLLGFSLHSQNQFYYWHGTSYIQPPFGNHYASTDVPVGPEKCYIQATLFWTCSGPGGELGDNEKIWGSLTPSGDCLIEISESDIRNLGINPPQKMTFYDVNLNSILSIEVNHDQYAIGDPMFFWSATYELEAWAPLTNSGE
jgi:hypothetical protein